MRGQADTRLKNTTIGMLRKSCCCELGWWGYAKRKKIMLAMAFARTCWARITFSQRARDNAQTWCRRSGARPPVRHAANVA
eukprot:915682-Pyramimonas_sp.AAC.1